MKTIRFIILFWVGCLLSTPITASLDNPTPITPENVAQLEELAILGRGGLSSMDISPDGEMLAIGTTAGVWIYNMNNLTHEPIYFNHGFGLVTNVTFDESGHFLNVVAVEEGRYKSIWYFEENFVKPTLVEKNIDYGQYVNVVGGYVLDAHGILWDWKSQTQIGIDFSVGNTYKPNYDMVVMNPESTFAVVAMSDGMYDNYIFEIGLFDLTTNDYFATMTIEEDAGTWAFGQIAFSMDGEYLLLAMSEHTSFRTSKIKMWHIGDILATRTIVYEDGITIWEDNDLSTNIRLIGGDLLLVNTIGIGTNVIHLPDGEWLQYIPSTLFDINPKTKVVIALETELYDEFDVVNITQNSVLGTVHDFGSLMESFTLNADKTQLITVNQNVFSREVVDDRQIVTDITYIKWWDIRTRQVIDTAYFYDVHDNDYVPYNYGEIVRFMPDGRPLVVVIDRDGVTEIVELWDLSSQQKLYQFEFTYSSEIQVSADGTTMIVFDKEANTIALYDISSPETPILQVTISSEQRIGYISPSPNNQYFVFRESQSSPGANDDSFRFWNIDQLQQVAQIRNLNIDTANFVQWSQDGQFMTICQYLPLLDKNYQFSFWRMDDILNSENPQPFMTLPVHFCHEKIFQSTPDLSSQGVFLIPDTGSGTIQQWSLDGQFVQEFLTENNGAFRYPVLHPDGSIIWGVNPYGQVTAWRLSDATELATFDMAPWRINQIEFVQDNSLMVVVAKDGTIRLWGIPDEEE